MASLFAFLRVISLLKAVWTAYSAFYLFRNYLAARKIGLPIRIIPISHTNPFWMLVDRHFISFIRQLPFGHNSFTRYNYRGWELADRYFSHHELGDAFIVVTPGRNWLYIANPDTIVEVFRRRTDFPRCLELTEILNVFGPNMSTVDGLQWKKQRKMTATCFNEQNNEIVWSETLGLANDMINYWSSKALLKTVAHDTRTLSLHVLSKAGFGKSFKFEGHDERKESSPSTSYKDSLQTILENCVLIMALGTKFLENPWLPQGLRRLNEACNAFQKYMTDLYEEEKQAFAEGRTSGRNLMSSLVRASQDEAKTGVGLTENEIYGNMFVFNFAGHDTTAHTFTFALYFLAANPQAQDWIYEELCQVLGDRQPDEWNYGVEFPRLKRCLSIMLETVRLYTPVPVAKWTDTRTQSLNVGAKTVVLPPDTMVIPSYASVQTDPKYWGSETLTWSPSRWIKTSNSTTANLEDEELITPQHGTFIGWSEGSRDCPGRKFSQVEFVGTMAVLFRDWKVDPVTQSGETIETARERVLRLIKSDSAPVLLLQMLHPERAPLVWKRR
ncbi:cytochrome P450 [Annulohypoxylon truncatum]|uniref:cytochrome P450 n=1 Tax=Annulohypoxylon truncatum TaxID=327061 RepID=UPI0020080A66|nr:cytochrome P450 [Annulohypoxylon truncatum]KAI1214484.1 cytochrome P450 [Annulohypoxylon truncatum]